MLFKMELGRLRASGSTHPFSRVPVHREGAAILVHHNFSPEADIRSSSNVYYSGEVPVVPPWLYVVALGVRPARAAGREE